ncbi:hypothetical protein KR038_002209 [Drosophila bunnanda]|nr:hypothetical protein KR038_002209 [Drosophila bunnanda]
MSRTFKVGRLGATYYWRIGGLRRNVIHHASSLRCLQRRYYADRYTIDDLTQSRIEAMYKPSSDAELPRENPWRTDFPKNLNDIGYESHCNDRLYMAKNKYRHNLQEYDQKRQDRRLEAQKRIRMHFNTDFGKEVSEMRKRSIMEDPAEHQKRQQAIIEMNRRQWQSRPQVKREINLSGITYRPDLQKQLIANSRQKSQDLDRQREFKRYQEKSEAEKGAEAETNWWIKKQMEAEAETKAEAEKSIFERRMSRLMGKYVADQEAERADFRTRKPIAKKASAEAEIGEAEAEAEDWRIGGSARGSPLQKRLRELMEAEGKPEAEEEDWRVKSTRAEAEEEDWRVKSPRAEAEEEDWRVKSPRAEAEEEDWRMQKYRGGMRQLRGRRPEAEEEDWRTKSWKPEAEEEDWRTKGWRPEAEEEDWRMKFRSPKAEEDWRAKSTRAEAESQNWRSKNTKADAERWRPDADEEDWRLKGWSEGRPVRSQSLSSGLQKRLLELMEAEKKPEAEEEDWRTKDPTAEAEEEPPRSEAEAETKAEAEDKAWKARNLSPVYDPNRPTKSWQKKREKEIEAQYWHSWHSCPDNQEAETNVEVKPHLRRKKLTVRPPSYTPDGQRRSYHRTALNPQPLETHSEPLDNAPLMPKPLRAIPKKPKKTKPKRKRERKSVEPPRFKMSIKTHLLGSRRPVNHLRSDVLSGVAGPSFQMNNLHKILNDCFQVRNTLVTEN